MLESDSLAGYVLRLQKEASELTRSQDMCRVTRLAARAARSNMGGDDFPIRFETDPGTVHGDSDSVADPCLVHTEGVPNDFHVIITGQPCLDCPRRS